MLKWQAVGGSLVAGLVAVAGAATSDPYRAVPVPIGHLYNSRATSVGGENDGVGFRNGSTYPSEYLPTGTWEHDGVPFLFPSDWSVLEYDNIAIDGQDVDLPDAGEVSAIHLIGAGQDPNGFLKSETTEELSLTFESGKRAQSGFVVRNWWCIHNANKGAIRAPFNYLPNGSKNWNASQLFHMVVDVPPIAQGRGLRSIRLPPAAEWNSLHVFALSITPAFSDPTSRLQDVIAVQNVKATRRWETVDGERAQVVEVLLANPHSVSQYKQISAWAAEEVDISLHGEGFRTIKPARLARLMPGDQRSLEILVVPTDKTARAFGTSQIHLQVRQTQESYKQTVVVGGSGLVHDWSAWTEAVDDLDEHSAPTWFKGAKFGIFIHWGLFAVPAYAPPKTYAEWYNYWLHDDPIGGPTYTHHREKYGEDFVYDDFIPSFTGSRFNASEWAHFFAAAGARYFVLTTKHHDGFALFDTKETSHRNTVRLGPQRDFLRELMDAAEKETPHVKRGTYFSMPEWFNPLYHKYGKQGFPGGLARSPYDISKTEPYTGFVAVDDYVEDLQLAQMKILADDYKTDMMWCDIGLANHSSSFASEWYATTAREDRQVTMNDRCGIGGDFNTPEMTQFGHAERTTWESCAGMDPYSFGYNKETPANAYRDAKNIIHTLVDIAAKGGNFLLNVGPTGEGEIVDAMKKPLLGAGQWLKLNGEAVYDTEPFILLPEYRSASDDVNLRFTRAVGGNELYIISLNSPPAHLRISAPLPILERDQLWLLSTGDGAGKHVQLPWTRTDGVVSIDMANVQLDRDGIAWVIKVVPHVEPPSVVLHLSSEL